MADAARLTSVINRLAKSTNRQDREQIVEDIGVQLEKAEDKLVAEADEHHEKFYDALEAFQRVSETINDSKMKVGMLREALTECRSYLQLKRERIYRLSNEHAEYSEMMQLLEQIDQIRKVPEKVDEMLQRHSHVEAAELLVATTDAIEGEALGQVIALHDFLLKLIDKADNMRKIVLTEMEQRIYDRRELTPGSSERRWTTDEVFAVLSHGIQALQVLHRPEKRNNNNAPVAISALRSNLKTELTMMMERAVADELIAQRADGSRELATAQDQSAPRLLHRFLSSLYEKMFHVLSCHAHILFEMRSTEEGRDTLARCNKDAIYSEMTVWDAIQLELQLLLCKYLDLQPNVVLDSYASNAPTRRKTMSAVDSSQLGDSQSTASLFSFANSLNAMTETAAKAERALTGLSPAYGASASSDNGDSGHGGQLLCEVSPMNVTGIYKATILFTAEMDKVVSEAEGESDGDAGSTRARRPRSTLRLTLGSFLDAFLSRAYLPIIKAEVHARLTSIAEAADKPLDDHGLADAPRVLFRSTVEVDEMVGQLCGLMFDLPSKCADFTEMLLHLISRYLLFAQQRFKALVRLFTPPKGKTGGTAISAEWQRQAAMQEHIKQLPSWAQLNDGVDPERGLSNMSATSRDFGGRDGRVGVSDQVATAESKMILELVKDVPSKTQSIFDMHTLKCIAYLHESMNWLADTLERVAQCLEGGDHRQLAQFWEEVGPVVDEDLIASEGYTIPPIIATTVTEAQISAIRGTATKYRAIAFACLATLRLEIRVHCLHYLMPVFRKSSHVCSAEQIEEADAQVVSLCKDILSMDETLSTSLHPARYNFVFDGLGAFLAYYIVKDLVHVKKVNDMGVMRVCRSIFALQQTLRSINRPECATLLDHAMQYYELLNLQPEQMIESLVVAGERKPFREAEYKVVLNLIEASQTVQNAAAHIENLKHLHESFQNIV